MSDDLKTKIWDWFVHLTYKRLFISVIAGVVGITGITLWENRQMVFENRTINYVGDYPLEAPSESTSKMVQAYVSSRPEVLLVSLLDANPVTNSRNVVHRWYGNQQTMVEVESAVEKNPDVGNGALFNSNQENNTQVLAVLAGEFYCAPVSGILLTAYPELAKRVKYSCRAPLPPAYGKATGWFAIHLSAWPPADMDQFKNSSLMMALTYYEAEIAKNAAGRR